MADRYWVGGTGTWDGTNTANWSTSSGGSGGASVPTAADNVFFDANSNVGTGAFTVTMANSPRVCNDFTASGLDGAMTLAGAAIGLTVSGSLFFPTSNFALSYSGTTTFNAITTGKTVTTNGIAFANTVNFNGIGGGWTLGSAFNIGANTLLLSSGTFDTSSVGNYAVTAGGISSSNSNARTINLNASTISLSGLTTPITFTTATNLTFNAGTSTINCANSLNIFAGGGQTFYNIAFTSTAQSTPSITGANTFNNLTITGRTSVGIGVLSLSANQTINGTFTVSAGTASAYRIQISTDTLGTSRTLTCAAVSLTDVDFRDITIAGAASPASGTRLGDCKGNSGITFDAAKTVYYRQTGSANWGATGSGSWSATSGGALDATQFPLAQDTAIFPAATYPASGSTTTINGSYNIGTIDMSLRTSNTMTLATGTTTPTIYGNWINGTGTTLSGTGTITFAGRTTQTITSAGIAFTQPITITSPSGSVTLQDALNIGANALRLTSGTFSANIYNVTAGRFDTNSTATRTVSIGSGTWTLSAAGATVNSAPWVTSSGFSTAASGLTVVAGTGTISFTSAINQKDFFGGGLTYPTINQAGAGSIRLGGNNTFANITNTYVGATIIEIGIPPTSSATVIAFTASGTAGNLLTLRSTQSITTSTLSKASGTVSVDYLSISRINATGGASWYAGANSTDGGNNSGWIFTAPPAPSGTNSNFLMFFQ